MPDSWVSQPFFKTLSSIDVPLTKRGKTCIIFSEPNWVKVWILLKSTLKQNTKTKLQRPKSQFSVGILLDFTSKQYNVTRSILNEYCKPRNTKQISFHVWGFVLLTKIDLLSSHWDHRPIFSTWFKCWFMKQNQANDDASASYLVTEQASELCMLHNVSKTYSFFFRGQV